MQIAAAELPCMLVWHNSFRQTDMPLVNTILCYTVYKSWCCFNINQIYSVMYH